MTKTKKKIYNPVTKTYCSANVKKAKDFAETLDPKEYDEYLTWAKVEIREYLKFIKAIEKLKIKQKK